MNNQILEKSREIQKKKVIKIKGLIEGVGTFKQFKDQKQNPSAPPPIPTNKEEDLEEKQIEEIE